MNKAFVKHHDPESLIETHEAFDDCGRDHACSFCPEQEHCSLDQPRHSSEQLARRLAKINWIIPVMANKGGVGKSTIAANLAVALAGAGYAVGLADADVHGPNAPRLLGLQNERSRLSREGLATPEFRGHKSSPSPSPSRRGHVKVGSLALMVDSPETPIVWRDAYKHDYIHHLLGSFHWGVLDFLVIDMPPGTGNELITLSEALKGCNTQALLVSSADAIALQDSLKAARYCQDTGLPILGLVENHAGVVCPHCKSEFELFPRAPEAQRFADLGIDTLARIPFTPEIGHGAASGVPAAATEASMLHGIFKTLAERCADQLIALQRSQHS